MLVLTRKLGEKIILSDGEVTITVVAIDAKTVRLGITAPAKMAVHREEVWQRICDLTDRRADVERSAQRQ